MPSTGLFCSAQLEALAYDFLASAYAGIDASQEIQCGPNAEAETEKLAEIAHAATEAAPNLQFAASFEAWMRALQAVPSARVEHPGRCRVHFEAADPLAAPRITRAQLTGVSRETVEEYARTSAGTPLADVPWAVELVGHVHAYAREGDLAPATVRLQRAADSAHRLAMVPVGTAPNNAYLWQRNRLRRQGLSLEAMWQGDLSPAMKQLWTEVEANVLLVELQRTRFGAIDVQG
jgi:hypothetical protein